MIIGRKEEQQELLRAYNSEYSEFVAVTGRRRIGKTFLIRDCSTSKSLAKKWCSSTNFHG